MEKLKPNDRATMEGLFGTTQERLLNVMETFLRKKYDKVVRTNKYMYAIGDLPVALVAHCDTVFPYPPEDIYYDSVKNVMWSPTGLGADDRAGVWIIIKLLQRRYKPHIILTTDEERGGIGALVLTQQVVKPFAEMKYIIQLDRRGTNDCVFYECDNEDFTDYVESFGFCEAFGTFSDISTICPAWKVAGVNLSVGYMDEHSTSETLHIGPMYQTFKKVCKMLDDIENAKSFEYIENPYGGYKWYRRYYSTDVAYVCCKCGKTYDETDVIPVKKADGSSGWVCPDCISDFGWCERCNEAFEMTENSITDNLCPDCAEVIFGRRGKINGLN